MKKVLEYIGGFFVGAIFLCILIMAIQAIGWIGELVGFQMFVGFTTLSMGQRMFLNGIFTSLAVVVICACIWLVSEFGLGILGVRKERDNRTEWED